MTEPDTGLPDTGLETVFRPGRPSDPGYYDLRRLRDDPAPEAVLQGGYEKQWEALRELAAPYHLYPTNVQQLGDGRWRLAFAWIPSASYAKTFSSDGYSGLGAALDAAAWTLTSLSPDPEDPMNIFKTKLFPYLTGEMLQGKPVRLTIKRVGFQKVTGPQGSENEIVLAFEEVEKTLILNKTNARTLARLMGPETDDWEGTTVEFYTERINAFGSTVEAIRVSTDLPKQKREAKPQTRAQAKKQAEPEVQETLEALLTGDDGDSQEIEWEDLTENAG